MNILVKICTLFVTHFWTFLAAFGMTVRVTVLSLIFATIIGIVVALIRLVGPKPLKAVGNVYISIIRGTPLMVQILFIYFGLLPAVAFVAVGAVIAIQLIRGKGARSAAA